MASSRWWQLAYLRSYAGMGKARGECVAGCTCRPREFDAHLPGSRVSQTVVSKLGVVMHASTGLDCPCTIRLTALNHTGSGSAKFKLVALFSGFQMYNPNFALHGQARPTTEEGREER